MSIKLKQENVAAAYKIADAKTKKVLDALFGESVKTPTLSNYTSVQSYEDACVALGELPINEADLKEVGVPSHIVALMKLETVSKALWGENFEPIPDADGSKTYWYPWIVLYTKEESDNMSEEGRGALLSAYASYGAPAGFGCLYTTARSSYAGAHLGFRLCQESTEKAKYFGQKFIRLWGEYLAFNFTIDIN